MTPLTLPANPRIELARTRRMLEDTALAAVPGTLVSLAPDHAAAQRWTAQVRSTSGRHVTVRLDGVLQSVVVIPTEAIARAA